MKHRRRLGTPDEPIELNLIPLIDVIMFLLIFFISTTSLMEDSGVSVDKPQAGGASQAESKSIILAVSREGKVSYMGKEIGINGVRPTVKRLCGKEALPVVLQTDENSLSGIVIRVIDEAKMGGAKDVSLAMDRS
jgi:biopolymer transport protein ExbD